jgi:alkanesulfonate monooxygenase
LLAGEIKIPGRRLIVHVRLDATPNDAYFAPLLELSEAPEIHVEGQTAEAAFFAIKHADCLWRLPSRPNQVYADALPVLHFGKETGLVSSIIARATRQEALDAAAILLPEFRDSVDDPASWITPYLWTGGVPGRVTMLGSFEELAEAIYGFKQNGISQFLFRGWPDGGEMAHFGNGVLPLVRKFERENR